MNFKFQDSGMAMVKGSLCLLMIFSATGCGKNEGMGGLFGGAGGAAIGASVAGRGNEGIGAAIGGLAGYALGSGVGRAADDQETAEEMKARERAHRREVAHLEQEKADIARANAKWCSICGRQEMDVRAKRCGPCGGSLCHEKYCPRCGERYKPTIKNKYCNYCEEPTLLRAQ